jgi:hypothetical protein
MSDTRELVKKTVCLSFMNRSNGSHLIKTLKSLLKFIILIFCSIHNLEIVT